MTKYMVCIEGKGCPSVEHNDYAEAVHELHRLLEKVGKEAAHNSPIRGWVVEVKTAMVSKAHRTVEELK